MTPLPSTKIVYYFALYFQAEKIPTWSGIYRFQKWTASSYLLPKGLALRRAMTQMCLRRGSPLCITRSSNLREEGQYAAAEVAVTTHPTIIAITIERRNEICIWINLIRNHYIFTSQCSEISHKSVYHIIV